MGGWRSWVLYPSSPPRVNSVAVWTTFISLRKVRTAGVVSSLPKTVLAYGAIRCFHPQAFPMLLHVVFDCGDQASHLRKTR